MSVLGFPRPLVFPEPPPYQVGVGGEYARTLAIRGQRHSFHLISIGWLAIIAAAALALLGTTARTSYQVERIDDDKQIVTLGSGRSEWFATNMGVVFGAGSVVCAAFGWQALDRATGAALLASASTNALSHLVNDSDVETDLLVYKMCIEAKVAWLEGRMNHDRVGAIAQSFFGEGRSEAVLPGKKTELAIPHASET